MRTPTSSAICFATCRPSRPATHRGMTTWNSPPASSAADEKSCQRLATSSSATGPGDSTSRKIGFGASQKRLGRWSRIAPWITSGASQPGRSARTPA